MRWKKLLLLFWCSTICLFAVFAVLVHLSSQKALVLFIMAILNMLSASHTVLLNNDTSLHLRHRHATQTVRYVCSWVCSTIQWKQYAVYAWWFLFLYSSLTVKFTCFANYVLEVTFILESHRNTLLLVKCIFSTF